MTPKVKLPKAGCSFHRDDVFALDNPAGIVRINRFGAASSFASPPSPFLSAITFDRVGTFGHRLLATGTANGQSTVYAIDAAGGSDADRRRAVVEGGMEVAPRTSGDSAAG